MARHAPELVAGMDRNTQLSHAFESLFCRRFLLGFAAV
jgi:hypothetical protein